MKKEHLRIIEGINKEAYNKYKDDLYTQTDVSPTLQKMAKNIAEGKHDDIVSESHKRQIRAFYKAGNFDNKKKELNTEVAQKLDDYVQKRLVEEIKAGNIPNPKDDPDFIKFKQKEHEQGNN